MNNFIRRANSALLFAVALLGLALFQSSLHPVGATTGNPFYPPDWTAPSPDNPSQCPPQIIMLSTCPTGTSVGWSYRYTSCIASGGMCCDYSTWDKYCITSRNPDGSTTGTSGGYRASYDASYFSVGCSGRPNGCS